MEKGLKERKQMILLVILWDCVKSLFLFVIDMASPIFTINVFNHKVELFRKL